MADSSPAKILLMEDETMLASMYQTKFQNEGFNIDIAVDGEDGLAKAKAGNYQIILVDIIMPKLDGFAVLKELRALPQYQTIPIILLTNLSQEEDMKKGKELGATDYWVKANLTPGQIVEKVRGLIS
jgi:DNA-binding response OmpR family regulator